MTSERDRAGERPEGTGEAGEVGLLLRAEDGAAYLIPRAALEHFRLTDEGRAAVEAQLAETAGGDVQGHQYIGQFKMTMPVWHSVWIAPSVGWWSEDPYRLNTSSGPYPGLR